MSKICEECDAEMNEFCGEEGDYIVSGFACSGCGWSFDTERELTAKGAERQRLMQAAGYNTVGPWTLCENGAGAYRALAYTDGDKIENRVAFIEKTPRIRVRRWNTCSFDLAADSVNWASGPLKGDGPEDVWARAWCDEALEVFGFRVPDPVKANWRA